MYRDKNILYLYEIRGDERNLSHSPHGNPILNCSRPSKYNWKHSQNSFQGEDVTPISLFPETNSISVKPCFPRNRSGNDDIQWEKQAIIYILIRIYIYIYQFKMLFHSNNIKFDLTSIKKKKKKKKNSIETITINIASSHSLDSDHLFIFSFFFSTSSHR